MQEQMELPQPTNVEVSIVANASSPDVISVSSSASRSPEIEVAEVEDMNGDPGETRWRRYDEPTEAEVQRRLFQKFPYVTRERNARQAIDAITSTYDKGGKMCWEKVFYLTEKSVDTFPGKDRPFRMIANWIEDYLEATESKSSRWWDMYVDQEDFWNHLPAILMVLAKRR